VQIYIIERTNGLRHAENSKDVVSGDEHAALKNSINKHVLHWKKQHDAGGEKLPDSI
jgi:hypothetical protein